MKRTIDLSINVTELLYFKNDLNHLPANKIFELTIDYPFSNPLIYKIKTGKKGMGLNRLLQEIGKAYRKAYANEDKYGNRGHGIGDLAITTIIVNYTNKTIKLDVSS